MAMIGNDDADGDEILSLAQHLPQGVEEEAMSEKLLVRVVFLAEEISVACEQGHEFAEDHWHLSTCLLDFLELDRHNANISSKAPEARTNRVARSLPLLNLHCDLTVSNALR